MAMTSPLGSLQWRCKEGALPVLVDNLGAVRGVISLHAATGCYEGSLHGARRGIYWTVDYAMTALTGYALGYGYTAVAPLEKGDACASESKDETQSAHAD